MGDGLARAAEIGSDDRAAHGLRLDHHTAKGLGLGAGMDDDIGGQQGCGHIGGMAGQHQGHALCGGQAGEFGGIARPAIAQQHRHGRAGQAGERRYQHPLALPAGEPGWQQQGGLAGAEAPGGAQRGHPRGVYGIGVKQARIHTAMDGAQPRLHLRMAGENMGADEIADGNDPRAARHHRIIQRLAREILIIGAMPGGDQRQTGQPRRAPGRPGGGAGAGMDDIHPLGAGQCRQPPAIAPDGRLAGEGQGEMLRPQGLQRRHEAPARAGHKGAAASLDDGVGDLQGAALHATRMQRRQNLEDGGKHSAGVPCAARRIKRPWGLWRLSRSAWGWCTWC